jgi:hypothetical protein
MNVVAAAQNDVSVEIVEGSISDGDWSARECGHGGQFGEGVTACPPCVEFLEFNGESPRQFTARFSVPIIGNLCLNLKNVTKEEEKTCQSDQPADCSDVVYVCSSPRHDSVNDSISCIYLQLAFEQFPLPSFLEELEREIGEPNTGMQGRPDNGKPGRKWQMPRVCIFLNHARELMQVPSQALQTVHLLASGRDAYLQFQPPGSPNGFRRILIP